MQATENYSFNLPAGTDKVNISKLNENFTDIDGYLADNTARLDALEANGGTGGGVTPALYVVSSSSETVDNMTWNKETWSNGYVRCWGEYTPAEDIQCNVEMTPGRYCGLVGVSFPDVFTSKPVFISITPASVTSVSCTIGNINMNTNKFAFTIINNYFGAETPSTISKLITSFYIEIRGDSAVG